MKQLRSTAILLVIAALVGGYIYFNERGPVGQEGSTELLRTDPARVQQIKLETTGQGAITLKQAGENWTVEQAKGGTSAGSAPVPADPTLVKTLTDSLQLLQSANVNVADKKLLKEYGLEKPASSLEVDGQRVEFGTKPSFDQSQVYARLGDRVALLPSTLADNAVKPFSDWRDKTILRVKTEDVTAFIVVAPLVKASFEKAGEKWQMKSPVNARADSSSVDSFLTSLSTTSSTGWLEDKPADLAKWGLKTPQATVDVAGKVLKVGKKVPGGYAAQNSSGDVVFTLPDTLWGQINRKPTEWREKKLVTFTTEDVSGLTVSARGSTKILSKSNEKWQVSGGAADEKVHTATTDILYAAQGWMAQDFVDQPGPDKNYGLDKPLAVLDVSGKNADKLTLGTMGGKAYVRNAAGTVFVISEGEVANVKSALDTLFASPKPGGSGR